MVYLRIPFLTFMNYEDPYIAEGVLHNLCPCFDVVVVQLGDILKTKNKYVEVVAVTER